MNNQSILVSIQQSVNQIKWKNPLQKAKALILCASIFNLYRVNGQLYSGFISLSRNYFISQLPSKRDYNIKKNLVDNGILICDNKYSVVQHIGKGYKFNSKFFTESNISSTATTFTYSTATNNSTISYLCPHQAPCIYYNQDRPFSLQSHFRALLERLTFSSDIDTQINKLSEIHAQNLTINENITDQYVYLTLTKKKYRYSLQKAIEFAKETNNDLIQYKDKFYIDTPDNFIANKSLQLRISYCHSVFNIKNKIFYCDRNDTNNRLDYNLTGLKKELFDNLLFDGEKLIELDIANAQFAIAAHLNETIDANFIDNAQEGSLYLYTARALNLSKGIAEDEELLKARGKALMFRVAFDKVKSDCEFEQVRTLFPEYMKWADSYKKQHGYKSFSILLQKKEAEIMIDGLLMALIAKGYDVFPIHDALRVKQSQVEEIRTLVNGYFGSVGFECFVRVR